MSLFDSIGTKFSNMDLYDKKNLALNLASGFAGMSGNPNTSSIQQGIYADQAALREDRKAKNAEDLLTKKENATAAWLERNGHIELAKAVYSGAMSGTDALKKSSETPAETFSMITDPEILKTLPAGQWQQSSTGKFIQLGDKPTERKTAKDKFGVLRYLDDGKPAFSVDPNATRVFDKEELANINVLRDDLGQELGQFNIIKQGYNNIMTFFKDPNQVTDYAMAVSFAKVLDPGSVAREGEVKAVTNAGAKFPAYRAAFNNAIKGTGAMDPKMRYDIATAATSLYKERSVEATNSIEKYNALGVKAGIPKGNIYMGSAIVPAMSIPPWIIPPALSAAQIGMTQKQWKDLPYKKKVEFMDSLKPGAK